MNNQASVTSELEPVLLELGKALFVCQAFEGTLVLLLSIISHEEVDNEEGVFSATVELLSKKTLGRLINRLNEKLDLPVKLTTHFMDGWKNRNWIVHEFLHKSVESLQCPKGRIDAISMLEKAKHQVKIADINANALLDLYLKVYGLSVNLLKANADKLWDYLNPPPNVEH